MSRRARPLRAKEIARSMTRPAVAKPFHKISTTIPSHRFRRVRLKHGGAVKCRVPNSNQRARAKRKRPFRLAVFRTDRGLGREISIERLQIGARRLCEMIVGKCRIKLQTD